MKLALVVLIVLVFVHPQKIFDPEECSGLCLFDGAVPAEQTVIIIDGKKL